MIWFFEEPINFCEILDCIKGFPVNIYLYKSTFPLSPIAAISKPFPIPLKVVSATGLTIGFTTRLTPCCKVFAAKGNKPPTKEPSAPYLILFINMVFAFSLPDKLDVSFGSANLKIFASFLWSGDAIKSVAPITTAPLPIRWAILEALLVPILATALTIGAALVALVKIFWITVPGAPYCVIIFARSPLQVSGLSGSMSFTIFWKSEAKFLSLKKSVPINNSSPILVVKSNAPDSIPLDISAKPSM